MDHHFSPKIIDTAKEIGIGETWARHAKQLAIEDPTILDDQKRLLAAVSACSPLVSDLVELTSHGTKVGEQVVVVFLPIFTKPSFNCFHAALSIMHSGDLAE
jgi:hypothetical protein